MWQLLAGREEEQDDHPEGLGGRGRGLTVRPQHSYSHFKTQPITPKARDTASWPSLCTLSHTAVCPPNWSLGSDRMRAESHLVESRLSRSKTLCDQKHRTATCDSFYFIIYLYF